MNEQDAAAEGPSSTIDSNPSSSAMDNLFIPIAPPASPFEQLQLEEVCDPNLTAVSFLRFSCKALFAALVIAVPPLHLSYMHSTRYLLKGGRGLASLAGRSLHLIVLQEESEGPSRVLGAASISAHEGRFIPVAPLLSPFEQLNMQQVCDAVPAFENTLHSVISSMALLYIYDLRQNSQQLTFTAAARSLNNNKYGNLTVSSCRSRKTCAQGRCTHQY